MKVYDVYSLMDKDDNILYIGQTTHWVNRLRQHKSPSGKFHNVSDIKLNRIMRFDSYEETLDLEHELQCYFRVSVDYPERKVKSPKITENLINTVKMGKFTITKKFVFKPLENL
jgi:predicted GIY-YIG superfamily endonuclease